jgi:hypothetical protein
MRLPLNYSAALDQAPESLVHNALSTAQQTCSHVRSAVDEESTSSDGNEASSESEPEHYNALESDPEDEFLGEQVERELFEIGTYLHELIHQYFKLMKPQARISASMTK